MTHIHGSCLKQNNALFQICCQVHFPPIAETHLKREEAKKRKILREYISSAVWNYALETREKTLTNYKGFDVVLPANMTREKPYIWLSCCGKYYVELGDDEIGNLKRIDNYLGTLDKHLEKLKIGLSKFAEKEYELRKELVKNENYIEQIEKCRAEVEKLDKQLGVDKK